MKLILIAGESMALRHNNKTYIGDVQQMMEFMISDLGVNGEECGLALTDFATQGTNVADFGLNGTFIFARKVDLGAEPLESIEKMAA